MPIAWLQQFLVHFFHLENTTGSTEHDQGEFQQVNSELVLLTKHGHNWKLNRLAEHRKPNSTKKYQFNKHPVQIPIV
jgi:hypothetical protein